MPAPQAIARDVKEQEHIGHVVVFGERFKVQVWTTEEWARVDGRPDEPPAGVLSNGGGYFRVTKDDEPSSS